MQSLVIFCSQSTYLSFCRSHGVSHNEVHFKISYLSNSLTLCNRLTISIITPVNSISVSPITFLFQVVFVTGQRDYYLRFTSINTSLGFLVNELPVTPFISSLYRSSKRSAAQNGKEIIETKQTLNRR